MVKNLTLRLTLMSILMLSGEVLIAQVGIGNTSPNATLDISASNSASPSNTDGILIPKIDEFPTVNPTAAQDGLLIFATGAGSITKGFYYWDTALTSWELLQGARTLDDLIDGRSDNDGTDNGSSIYIGLGAGSNDDQSNNANLGIGRNAMHSNTTGVANVGLGYHALYANIDGYLNTANGTYSLPTNDSGIANNSFGAYSLFNNTAGDYNNAIGVYTLFNNTTGNLNTAIGYRTLYSNTTGFANIGIGHESLFNTTGNGNTGIGFHTLYNNTSGSDNIAIGFDTMYHHLSGNGNNAIGSQALRLNTTGANNNAYGRYALQNNVTGNNNVAIGYQALRLNTGSSNVALGHQAGYNETGSNKLYIDNSATTNPLLYGEFDNNLLRVNGTLNINNSYNLPTTDGSSNQVLQTNGSGALTWTDLATDNDWIENGNNVYKLTGNVGIGTGLSWYPLHIIDGNASHDYSISVNKSYTGSSVSGGISNVLTHTGTGNTQSYGMFTYLNKPAGTANSGATHANYGYAINRYAGSSNSESFGAYNLGFKYAGSLGNSYGSSNFSYNENGPISYGVYANPSGGTTRYGGYFVGDVYSSGSYLPSARKLKKNITPSRNAIQKILDIEVHEYQYDNDSYRYMNLPEGTQTGFIAEEIQELFPELTKKAIQPKAAKELVDAGIIANHTEVEFTAVNYVGLIPHLVKGIQEQQAMIESLLDRVKTLELQKK